MTPELTSSRFSPGNVSGEILERMLVGRQDLLEEVLARVSASAEGREKHHILLVGQRGTGKTHFLSVLKYRLMHESALEPTRAQLLIAHLSEEEWGVASYLDLLVRILRAMAAEQGSEALGERLEQVYEAHSKSPDASIRAAETLLSEHVGDRVLLLLCENLSDLLREIGDEGQRRWRALIQENSFWTIVATTPEVPASLRSQRAPFYGFFAIRPLNRLDFSQGIELLRRKALLEGRSDLAALLTTPVGRARARGIHHLTGGNHRLYVILSDFLTKESLSDLVSPFLRMVDDLTPYYQERMRLLAPLQRKIVGVLSEQAKPLIVKQIGARCLSSPEAVAKQLRELAKLGLVCDTRIGRETYYELAEPLMRICVEVKDNRSEHLKLFVEFLRHWFSATEMRKQLQRIPGADSSLDAEYLRAALAECGRDGCEPFLASLEEEERSCWRKQDWSGLLQAADRLSAEREEPEGHLSAAFALMGLGRYDEALSRIARAAAQFPQAAQLFNLAKAPALAGLKRTDEATLLLNQFDAKPSLSRAWAFWAACALADAGAVELALELIDRLIALVPQRTAYRCLRGSLLFDLNRFEEVVANERALLEIEPDHEHSFPLLIRSLIRLSRPDEAVSVAKEWVEHTPKNPMAWAEWSHALDHARQPKAMLDVVSRGLSMHPGSHQLLYEKIHALYLLGADEDAQSACRSLADAAPDSEIGIRAARGLASEGRLADAVGILDRLTARFCDEGSLFLELAFAQIALRKHPEALASAKKAQALGADELDGLLVEAEASVGALGLTAGLNCFARALSLCSASKPDPERSEEVARTASSLLSREIEERGILALARQADQVRELFASPERPPMLGAALADLIQRQLRTGGMKSEEWAAAIPLIRASWGTVSECQIPLAMLSATVGYLRSSSLGELMALPKEQRDLLLEYLEVPAGRPERAPKRG